MQITENTSIDTFLFGTIICVALACVGVYALANYSVGVQNEAFADIEQMGCGELKEFIADQKWQEYGARQTTIKEQAMHTYTWTCEK